MRTSTLCVVRRKLENKAVIIFTHKRHLLVVLLSCLLVVFPLRADSHRSSQESLSSIVKRYSSTLVLSVTDPLQGAVIFEHNAAKPVKPASVLKIVTTLALLKRYGPEHVFTTEILVDEVAKGVVRTLYVRGGGDPSLNLEEAWLIVRKLKQKGISRIDRLVLDDAAFDGERDPVGTRAYQTGSAALSFNYNSYGFTICPGDKKGSPAYVSADPPESGIIIENNVGTTAGDHCGAAVVQGGDSRTFRVKGAIGVSSKCATYYRSVDDPPDYFGRTFLALLEGQGVKVPKQFSRANVPATASLVMIHGSKPLKSILGDLNHFSNNFIGEQLLFLLGDSADVGEVAALPGRFRRSLGLRRLAEQITLLGYMKDQFVLADGSGLSHQNRLTARMLTDIFHYIEHDEAIRPEFEDSLSVAFRSGTLKKREFEPSDLTLRAKTGTLDGVSALAGFLINRQGRKLSFAIIQNGVASKDKAVQVEDQIVKALYENSL